MYIVRTQISEKGSNMNKLKTTVLLLMVPLVIVLSDCSPQKSNPNEKQQPQENEQQSQEVSPPVINLDEIMEKAKKGMIEDSKFTVMGGNMEEVKAEWGEPDQVDQAGYGYYAAYDDKNVTFGFNKADEIFDLRSYAKDLKEVTVQMIEDAFGSPAEVRKNNNERIYVYELEHGLELKFIIPIDTKVVDHLSVFHPQRAIAEDVEKQQDYVLDIKGKSNKLTAQAWKGMQSWRKQIVLFAKEQEKMYMNGPDKKIVALTFDDGPDGNITPAIIDILDKYQVKGSFFFLGSEVEAYPEVVKNAYNKGNLILSHSYNHVDLTTLSKEEIRLEIDRAGKTVKSVIGKEPAILRTPYGETNDKVASIAEQEGYSIVLWSIDTLDWSQKEYSNIVNNVVENVRNGDIILMHSDSEKTQTTKALPLIIEALQEQNFEIVDLETLLGVKAYQ